MAAILLVLAAIALLPLVVKAGRFLVESFSNVVEKTDSLSNGKTDDGAMGEDGDKDA